MSQYAVLREQFNLTVLDPSVSRLRSHMRTTSSTTEQSYHPPAHSRTDSHFSQISLTRSDSPSSLSNNRYLLPEVSIVPFEEQIPRTPAFSFHPLRQLSAHLFSRRPSGNVSPIRPSASRKTSSLLGIPVGGPARVNGDGETGFGKPTVMDVKGMIAVGTESGRVLVYGFDQDIKYILGSEVLGMCGSRP